MLKLDNNLLDELGLGALSEDQKKSMLQHIYETLELRVGTNLANQMTDQQLDEFEKFIDDGGEANQAQALQWLEANLPNYKQVVNDVFEALKVEIKQMAPQIVAASVPTTSSVGAGGTMPQQVPGAGPTYAQNIPANGAVAQQTPPAYYQQTPMPGRQPVGVTTVPQGVAGSTGGITTDAPVQSQQFGQSYGPQSAPVQVSPVAPSVPADPTVSGGVGYQPTVPTMPSVPATNSTDPMRQQSYGSSQAPRQTTDAQQSSSAAAPGPHYPQQQPPAGPGGYGI